MKQAILLLLCAVLPLSLLACHREDYRSDLTSAQIAAHAAAGLPLGQSAIVADAHFLDDYFEVPDFVSDYEIRFCSDRNNLDEFGIFQVDAEHAKEMHALLSDYLSRSLEQNRAWYDSYIPQQTPKLRDAEARVFGNIVAYAVLSPADRAAFFQSVEAILQK